MTLQKLSRGISPFLSYNIIWKLFTKSKIVKNLVPMGVSLKRMMSRFSKIRSTSWNLCCLNFPFTATSSKAFLTNFSKLGSILSCYGYLTWSFLTFDCSWPISRIITLYIFIQLESKHIKWMRPGSLNEPNQKFKVQYSQNVSPGKNFSLPNAGNTLTKSLISIDQSQPKVSNS